MRATYKINSKKEKLTFKIVLIANLTQMKVFQNKILIMKIGIQRLGLKKAIRNKYSQFKRKKNRRKIWRIVRKKLFNKNL